MSNSQDNDNNQEPKEPNLTEAERNLLLHAENDTTRDASDVPPLYKFVFTGGPCGGKTTSLARVFSFLRERNFEVINCPEAYTILNSNGMSADFFSTPGIDKVIQGTVMDCQLTFEDGVKRVLQARGKPAIMLCDRGLMDGSIFIKPEDFDFILSERNLDIVQARDNRYDAVFHLVTAADGAEEFYTLENNKVRWETKEQARMNDKLIQKAWVGHPHLYIIDNTTDFEGKMNRLIDIICKLVGLPSNLTRRSARFLLKCPPDLTEFPADIKYQVFEVEKVYLLLASSSSKTKNNTNENDCSSNKGDSARKPIRRNRSLDPMTGKPYIDNDKSYCFIRRRSHVDIQTGKVTGSVYQITNVYTRITFDAADNKKEENIEEKRIISRREYELAYTTGRDHSRHVVKQKRISFLYGQQSFNIHIYQHPSPNLCILHAQVEAGLLNNDDNNNSSNSTKKNDTNCADDKRSNEVINLPPFLQIDRRLNCNGNSTEDDEKYGAYSLSIIRN